MAPSLQLTDDILVAFFKCRYKAYLKLRGEHGEKSEYEQCQARLLADYKGIARQELRRRQGETTAAENLPSLREAVGSGAPLISDVVVSDAGESCRLDALERIDGEPAVLATYRPILFVRREKVAAQDRLLLAFGASILTPFQGQPTTTGRIVHGPQFKSSRVELTCLSANLREATDGIRALAMAPTPPPLQLNRHCPECEFRRRCRAAAVEKDDLSLLGGLASKEIAALQGRGIFTVTQYSYTFRPRRMKLAAVDGGRKHDHSLQALAVREKTIYVGRRPELPESKVQLYLDVEGLPDEDWYYLIGLTVCEGQARRQLSLWADSKANESCIWASFLAAVGVIEDFVLFHYGSYETHFLKQMEVRHGGDKALLARIKTRSVNVLSQIYSRVYFPTYGNDLKSVAGCLQYCWSVPEASGLQSIAWRYGWESTRDENLKQRLLTYNEEDCSALERVVDKLKSLVGDPQPQLAGSGPQVADVKDVAGQHRYNFGTPKFALTELAQITKCAYFDYQRDKVLCRTSPHLKKAVKDKKRKKQAWKVNKEVEWGRPASCPHCGSTGFDLQARKQKLVVDMKLFHGGIKRQVTRHKAARYRCRKCWGTFLPADYLALCCGYGRGVSSWVVYSSISLRQSNEAIGEALEEFFGVRFGRCYATKIRQRAVERYRVTYEGLLTSLRSGLLIHADETKAKLQGPLGDGYVWVFARPDTAVYIYAPTRDGDTAKETLVGFKGVLVSDFYSAYDSLDCPQQKCLIHLIRDVNDDLLKHPFDAELREQASRVTSLLQTVVATIDRYGLKKYHLHKHQRDVDRFYDLEGKTTYSSTVAGHYQQRLLKYRGKLFTFLDHDGVPWNNNTAENAVKQFASRRKALRTPFTEAGIRDYLLFLSIYQTLWYRNASFWKFLLSGETDIETFSASRH